MPNAAPFLASPWKRVVAGAVDTIVYLFILVVVLAALLSEQVRGFYEISVVFIASATYILYHVAFFLLFDDATPGLRSLNMRIVSTRGGEALSIVQMVVRSGLRPLMLTVFGFTMLAFFMKRSFEFEPLLAPLVLELVMMFTLPSRQTLSDLVARTLVVNVPPPQPHRAPAGPMYSPSDAEFGLQGGRK